jgi:hypothetical protein
VDCDLYSSTKTIFDLLGHLIYSGTIIIFDELIGYRFWRRHEYKAWMEFVKQAGIAFHYIAFCGMKAAVKIDAVSA